MKWIKVIKIALAMIVVGSVLEPSAEIYADQQLSRKPLIYAGKSFSGVINSDGSVWSWGDNEFAQLGRGNATESPDPIPNLATKMKKNIVQVSAGNDTVYALSSDGELLAWGSNKYGELGNTVSLNYGPIPAPVSVYHTVPLKNMVSVDGGNRFGVAIKNGGRVWIWGDNKNFKLGTRDGMNVLWNANQINYMYGLIDVTSVSAGEDHTVAVSGRTGLVFEWGYTSLGFKEIPTGITAGFKGAKVSAGSRFTVALKSDGTVWSWGNNGKGELGDGTLQFRTSPVQVKGPNGQGFLDQIVAIDSGDDYTLALRADGTVWSWGANTNGQLGVGSTQQSSVPVQVEFKDESGKFIKMQSLAAGSQHNLALSIDKQLFTWGSNLRGELGTGDFENRLTPVKVNWHDTKLVYYTSYQYDTSGRILRKIIAEKEGTVVYTYQYIYDPNGNLKKIQMIQP